MAFTPRTAKPEAGNKYYITKKRGGYSSAIQGSPTDKDCDVLSNCVGYAYGRFNEIANSPEMKYLAPVNAECFMQHKGNLKSGSTPQLGACAVWQKGATLKGSDGAGHVAIVEKIISPTEIVTSESGYNAKSPFWLQTRKKGNGNWGQKDGYKFLGFIYNSAVFTAAPGKEKGNAEMGNKRYQTLAEIPEYAKDVIQKLIKSGALKGTASGLDLSEDMLRILVILDRAGVFGK